VNDWTAAAACRGRDPRVWFPRPHDRFAIEVARQVCAGCPVRADCLADAMAAPFDLVGIWGGLTEHERQSLRARAREAASAAGLSAH
jgi:WhiB family redox-sensing transcriptional regulator